MRFKPGYQTSKAGSGRRGRGLALIPVLGIFLALTGGGCATLVQDWTGAAEPARTGPVPESKQAQAYQSFVVSQMELKQGRRNEAVDSLRRALENDPRSATLRAELVSLLVQAGRMDEALKEAKEAVARSEKDIRAKLLLAGIMATKGDIKGAEKVYRQILEIDPYHGESLLFLSTILVQEKRREEAVELLKQHVAHDPRLGHGPLLLRQGASGFGAAQGGRGGVEARHRPAAPF